MTSEVVLTILTAGLAGLGIFLAYMFYGRKEATPEVGSSGSLYRLLVNKYYVDEFYDFLLVQPFTAISRWLATVVDPGVIDGVVNGVGNSIRGSGLFWRRLQTGNVQHYLLAFLMEPYWSSLISCTVKPVGSYQMVRDQDEDFPKFDKRNFQGSQKR